MKIRNHKLRGSGNHVLPMNAVIEVVATNTSDSPKDYEVRLHPVSGDYATFGKATLAPKESQSFKAFGEAQERIEVLSDEAVHTLINRLQETTAGSGGYSKSCVYHNGDGVNKTFLLGSNAPANNNLEVEVIIDNFYRLKFGRDWRFSEDKRSVILTDAPYSGAEIALTLMKQE